MQQSSAAIKYKDLNETTGASICKVTMSYLTRKSRVARGTFTFLHINSSAQACGLPYTTAQLYITYPGIMQIKNF